MRGGDIGGAEESSAGLLFTVIIPTYNRPHALRGCLESLAAQCYPRALFEVIVVDDGGG